MFEGENSKFEIRNSKDLLPGRRFLDSGPGFAHANTRHLGLTRFEFRVSNFEFSPMSLPAERQEAIRATLGAIHDPQERLAVAMSWKARMAPLKTEERTEEHLVRGCASRVWLAAEMVGGRCRFRIDADSPLVRGLAGLLCGIYEGATPVEVVAEEPVVLEELHILRNLSPTRQNGLAAIRRALVEFAAREG
jgi:cysteine desulfuration protein SufE